MKELEPYQKRLIIEYRQLVNRIGKLDAMFDRYREGTLDFTPKTPITLLIDQANRMTDYLLVLEKRAELEGIDLESYDPISDMVEALARDLCERETMCEGDPHQLDEMDAQTQESYREEARMNIEAIMRAVTE